MPLSFVFIPDPLIFHVWDTLQVQQWFPLIGRSKEKILKKPLKMLYFLRENNLHHKKQY